MFFINRQLNHTRLVVNNVKK